MSKRIALLAVFVSFFFCYLEWGKDQSSFLYEVAYQILFKQGDVQNSFSHPLILLPFLGELILLFQAFQKVPSKRWTYLGISLPAILVLFLLFIGIMGQNFKIIASTLPFLISSGWVFGVFRGKDARALNS